MFYCPILERAIQQHKKDIENARMLARSGYGYFEVQDKSGEYLISKIVKIDFGEYRRKKLTLSRKKIGRYKAYKTVNGYWGTSYNDVKEQYDTDVELDCPALFGGWTE